jgi:hypothetical protein
MLTFEAHEQALSLPLPMAGNEKRLAVVHPHIKHHEQRVRFCRKEATAEFWSTSLWLEKTPESRLSWEKRPRRFWGEVLCSSGGEEEEEEDEDDDEDEDEDELLVTGISASCSRAQSSSGPPALYSWCE